MIELAVERVEVRSERGGVQHGVMARAPDGRMLFALMATSAEELTSQLDEAGGVASYLRRFGVAPLDPEGIAPSGDAVVFVAPSEPA